MSFNKTLLDNNQIWRNSSEIGLNDLPKYSPWPARLLGLEEWSRPERTQKDIQREFETETYAPQYSYLLSNPEVNDFFRLHSALHPNSKNLVCSSQGQFKQLALQDVYTLDLAVIAANLARFLPASAIVDIGAGTGRTLVGLGELGIFSELPLFGLEKMPSARQIISEMATRKGVSVHVEECDLTRSPLSSSGQIPENAIFYTNSVLYTLNHDIRHIIENILPYKPRVVLHFEPALHSFDSTTLYGKLCAAYLEINKYNMSFDSELKNLDGDIIDIVFEDTNIFTSNPFFSRSIVAWVPKN